MKSIHIISVISWMAALLYLPRLFVYHSNTSINSVQSETFKLMERRLIKVIMFPAMLAVFISGSLMIYINLDLIYELYFQVKLILVLVMGMTHSKFVSMFKDLETDKRKLSSSTYRIWNEVPTCIMIFIVLLIVIKPF